MTLAKLTNNWFPSAPSIFDRFFEGDMMDWNVADYSAFNSTLPAVNIKEGKKEFEIEVAAPGMNKEDFRLNYEGGRLTISSERKNEKEEKEGEKVTRREFSYQAFRRSFNVPEDVIAVDKISASYKNGILQISLPRREEVIPAAPKQIKIS